MYCSGLTIGICLTPVDEAHGGLDVMAGSHRANIARAQVDRGIDLPSVTLRAARGDVTVHLSCALHRSTHPMSPERRVAYTGFTLPTAPGRSSPRRRAGAPRARARRHRGSQSTRAHGVRARADARPRARLGLASREEPAGVPREETFQDVGQGVSSSPGLGRPSMAHTRPGASSVVKRFVARHRRSSNSWDRRPCRGRLHRPEFRRDRSRGCNGPSDRRSRVVPPRRTRTHHPATRRAAPRSTTREFRDRGRTRAILGLDEQQKSL